MILVSLSAASECLEFFALTRCDVRQSDFVTVQLAQEVKQLCGFNQFEKRLSRGQRFLFRCLERVRRRSSS